MEAVLFALIVGPFIICFWMLLWLGYRVIRKMISEGDL